MLYGTVGYVLKADEEKKVIEVPWGARAVFEVNGEDVKMSFYQVYLVRIIYLFVCLFIFYYLFIYLLIFLKPWFYPVIAKGDCVALRWVGWVVADGVPRIPGRRAASNRFEIFDPNCTNRLVISIGYVAVAYRVRDT